MYETTITLKEAIVQLLKSKGLNYSQKNVDLIMQLHLDDKNETPLIDIIEKHF